MIKSQQLWYIKKSHSYLNFISMKKILTISVFALAISISNKVMSTVFYSQNIASQNFVDITNWNTLPNGSGVQPLLVDFTNGLHTFLVQNGHTVLIDQNISVTGLIVGQAPGANANLEIKGGTNKTITIESQIYVDANGRFRTDNTASIHQVNITGNTASITNLSILDLRRSATSVSNLSYTGNGVLTVSGSSNINLYGLSNNGGGTITTIGSMIIYEDLLLTSSSTLTGTANIQVRGNTTVHSGSTISMNNGTFSINNVTDQTLTCDGTCIFYSLSLDNAFNTTNSTKTIVGEITIDENLRVFSDAIFDGSSPINLNRNLQIDNDFGWVGTGTITFNAPSTRTGTITAPNVPTIGTADNIINGYISLANNTYLLTSGNVTVTDNQRLIFNGESGIYNISGDPKTFSLGENALFYIYGSDAFPADFQTYSLATTSDTRYLGVDQTVKGNNIIYGGLNLGGSGNKDAQAGDIKVSGNLTLNSGSVFRLISSDLRIGGNINGNGGTLDCRQTTYLDGIDKNQTLSGTSTYIFNNLTIENNAPTAIRTKTISNDIIVKNNFTCTNTDGDASNYLIVNVTPIHVGTSVLVRVGSA